MIIISNLKELRKQKGLSQNNCAHVLDIPLRTYKRYEQGNPIGDVEYLCRIVLLFDISIDELIGGKKETNNYVLFNEDWEKNDPTYIKLAINQAIALIDERIEQEKYYREKTVKIAPDKKCISLNYVKEVMEFIAENYQG